MPKRGWIIGVLLLMSIGVWGAGKTRPAKERAESAKERKDPTKGMQFFYRTGNWMDNFLMHNVDTSYIVLPEHSWRVAFTSGMLGINSTLHSNSIIAIIDWPLKVSMYNKTTPSVDLGFNVGYRGFGFGYSWDALDAYAQKLNFSFGSKSIGIDFSYQTSTNIRTVTAVNDTHVPGLDTENNVVIRNANLGIWYALNAAHYSHQAAILGAGRDRVQRALDNPQFKDTHAQHDRYPVWFTDYFWSPK